MEEMYKEEYGIFIPILKIYSTDDRYMTISASDYSVTYDDAIKELKKLYHSSISNGFSVEWMEIQEIRGSWFAIENYPDYLKYKDADLSDLPYEERKSICQKFVSITTHYLDMDLNERYSVDTLYDGTIPYRYGISEDMEIFNIGDRVKCKHTNLAGTVILSPGIPYSNVKWEYVYDIKCDNEDYGIKHLNGHELKKD